MQRLKSFLSKLQHPVIVGRCLPNWCRHVCGHQELAGPYDAEHARVDGDAVCPSAVEPTISYTPLPHFETACSKLTLLLVAFEGKPNSEDPQPPL